MSVFKRSFITWAWLLAGFAILLNWPQRAVLMPYYKAAGFPWPFAVWFGKWPEWEWDSLVVDLFLWTFAILAVPWACAWARARRQRIRMAKARS